MKKTKVIFESYPTYSNHAKALYEYMKKTYENKMDFYWIVNNNEEYELLKGNINCIINNSEEFFQMIKKADIIFTTHGQLIEYKTNNQIYVNLWHGIGPKKIGYILDEKNLAPQDEDFYYNLQLKTDYIIVPSKFWQLIFCSIFKTDYNRILPIGYPKLDHIINSRGKDNLYKILGLKKEYEKIIFYTPTFKKSLGRIDETFNKANIFNLESYDENILLDFLEKNNYLLCIKHHPSEENSINKIKHPNVKYIIEEELRNNNLSINEILNSADILITDYSSLGLEFSFLEKPVIYLTNTIEEYKKNRGIIFDDENIWMTNNANDIGNLINKISKQLKSGKQKIHHQIKEMYYGNLKDGGCKNICDYFFDANGKINDYIIVYNSIPKKKIETARKTIKKQREELELIKLELESQRKQLKLIYNSKSWILLEKLRSIKRKLGI